jgi:hypothetical protein
MEQNAPVKYRINLITAGFMVGFALIVDGVQFLFTLTGVLAIANSIISILAEFSLWLWCMLVGVNYFGGKQASKNIIAVLTAIVVELVPVLDALPAFTTQTIILIYNSRVEDRQNHSENLKAV